MEIYNGLFYVYAHINTINGKIYIGISKRKNPNERWKNGKGYNYNWHFNKAIEKYGWDKFDHEIIASNLTENEASNMEKILIEQLKTFDRNYGYNFAEGGYNNRGLKGKNNPFYGIKPEAAIKASIAARTGKPLSEEHKKKIQESCKRTGVSKNSLNALILCQHMKKNMPTGADNHKSKAVKCVETGAVYESQRIAEHEMNLPRGSIYQALKYNIRAKGYSFERV